MEVDLNQEPLDPTQASSVVEFDSLLEELESAHERVQDRIRHLEAITSRARQRQRSPLVQSPIQITNFMGEAAMADAQDEGLERREVEERMVESGKGYKRKGADLIAKALEVVTDVNKEGANTGNFFDCNICLGTARDPVLTCCGHLFCWPCFYLLAYVYSGVKECPVCKGEVTESGIVPIYGNADASGNSELEMKLKVAGLRVPPRPGARRIESFRQQLISQGAPAINIIQSIRRFNNLIGGIGERVQSESPNTAADRNNVLPTQSRLQVGNNQHTGSSPISRLLVQGAASFSTLSSALNSAMDSAERLVEDLQSYIHDNHVGGGRQLNRRVVNRNSASNGNVAATDSAAAASPFSRNVDNAADIGSEIWTTDSNIQTETSPLDPSSSYSGSTNASTSSRVSNDPRRNDPRRRRLR